MNWIVLEIAMLSIALILLELALRIFFGFGDPLLYIADAEIGYLLAPNQSVRRFGNRIEINQYSMRSRKFTPKPEIGTKRVLMIGDSIINGGWWTDQKEVVSELVMRSNERSLEVLNASANSWSPRNELAYLKRFGTFNADVIVLVINTDDLFGTPPTSLGVGRDRNYPDRKPMSAIVEVVDRYLLPAPKLPAELKQIQSESGDRVGINLDAIQQIRNIANQNNAKFVLAMTPLLRELTPPGSRDYEITARQRLIEMTQAEQIQYIDFLPIFQAESTQAQKLYRDHIHLSSSGNRLLSDRIRQSI
ncbi:MAG: SGNH/GDSL hydrolase family protein [Phormidium tanganyikae FI6-MK23]|jgi:lysophospholipase L1-like esterase|nr:SGNH/GDSL hydrolase family protein [Phormidium tanganyikae FI6-MK23]